MNKNIITYAAIAIITVIPTAAFAQLSTGDSSSSAGLSTGNSSSSAGLSTGNSGSSAGISTGNSGSSAGLSTGNSSSSAGQSTGGSSSSAGLTTGGSSSSAGSVSSGGGSTSGGSSSSVSHSSSGSYVGYSGSSGYAIYTGCPLVTTYMKIGAVNDVAQVTKLQNFLKNVEKINVVVTGAYDVQTVSAVKAFQNKYPATTMGPWGITEATGNVYITTTKKINQIACNQALTLNSSELALINAGKNAIASAKAQPGVSASTIDSNSSTEQPINIPVISVTDSTSTVAVDNSTETGAANTASVGKASILSRFWNFLVYLFK
jgi:virulence-associated protein VapD